MHGSVALSTFALLCERCLPPAAAVPLSPGSVLPGPFPAPAAFLSFPLPPPSLLGSAAASPSLHLAADEGDACLFLCF